jgi:DNA-binding transcriptional MerR regulator
VTQGAHLSIGEVLGLLMDEFPDVTISKIRFLESQGLIEPERTASGYRKFSDSEVERLRFILREQREHYLPLKVIRSRLAGDTSNDLKRPELTPSHGLIEVPAAAAAAHPSARGRGPRAVAAQEDASGSWSRDDLLSALGVSAAVLQQIRAAGLVTPRMVGGVEIYDESARAVAAAAARLLELGIDARHLKGFRHSAEREMTLYEQRVVPIMRQRSAGARGDALDLLSRLEQAGSALRDALVTASVKQHRDKA